VTLYIYLPDSDHFSVDNEATTDRKEGPTSLTVRWIVSGEAANANDTPVRSGECRLSELPAANRIVVVVPIARIAFIDATLPKVSPQKREQLLNFAIEDKLTIDPSTVHAVEIGESASGPHQYVVAAIDRAWLSAALAWLSSADIKPQLAVPETSLHYIADGEWLVVLKERDSYAVRPDGLAFGIDYDRADLSAPPFALTLALNEAAASAGSRALPTRLQIRALPDIAAAIDHPRWQTSLGAGSAAGLDLKIAPLAEPMLPDVAERKLSASDLLTGDFKIASEVTAGLKRFKLAALLVCSVLVLHITLLSVDAWRTARGRQTLETELRTIFLTSFPQATAVVNAPLQMTRNLRQLENERGLTVEPVVAQLALAASITRDVAPQITNIVAKDGVLTLSLTNLSAENLSALRSAAGVEKSGSVSVADSGGNVSLVIRATGNP
jgi:general secretion pathway protein L